MQNNNQHKCNEYPCGFCYFREMDIKKISGQIFQSIQSGNCIKYIAGNTSVQEIQKIVEKCFEEQDQGFFNEVYDLFYPQDIIFTTIMQIRLRGKGIVYRHLCAGQKCLQCLEEEFFESGVCNFQSLGVRYKHEEMGDIFQAYRVDFNNLNNFIPRYFSNDQKVDGDDNVRKMMVDMIIYIYQTTPSHDDIIYWFESLNAQQQRTASVNTVNAVCGTNKYANDKIKSYFEKKNIKMIFNFHDDVKGTQQTFTTAQQAILEFITLDYMFSLQVYLAQIIGTQQFFN